MTYNYILVSAIISWAAAQIIKTILCFIKTSKFSSERLLGAGGMPSSHSSFVTASVVAVLRKTGGDSIEFAIAFIVAAVVIYDAMGVRHAAGMHAKEINKMNKYLVDISTSSKNEVKMEGGNKKELKEFLGHTPLEVLGGVLLGIVVALMVPLK
ncbi:MAG TPA: divergent PAP2 family protein [Clostridiales bacterium]|nr:divergent PAP2 family protein [Clostridiales bacterium]